MFEQLGRHLAPRGPVHPVLLSRDHRRRRARPLAPGRRQALRGVPRGSSSESFIATKWSEVSAPLASERGLWRRRPLPGPCSFHLFVPSFIRSGRMSVSEARVLGSVLCLERDPRGALLQLVCQRQKKGLDTSASRGRAVVLGFPSWLASTHPEVTSRQPWGWLSHDRKHGNARSVGVARGGSPKTRRELGNCSQRASILRPGCRGVRTCGHASPAQNLACGFCSVAGVRAALQPGDAPLLLWTQAWVRSRPQPESAQVLGKGSQLASRGLGVSLHGPGEPGSLISVRSLSPLQGHRERKGHHLDRALGTHTLRIGLPQP